MSKTETPHDHDQQETLERWVNVAMICALVAAGAICAWYVYGRIRENNAIARASVRPPTIPHDPFNPPAPPNETPASEPEDGLGGAA